MAPMAEVGEETLSSANRNDAVALTLMGAGLWLLGVILISLLGTEEFWRTFGLASAGMLIVWGIQAVQRALEGGGE